MIEQFFKFFTANICSIEYCFTVCACECISKSEGE